MTEAQLAEAKSIGIKQSFDLVKMVQANTDNTIKASILDDIADLIIEEAHEYNIKWKSITELTDKIVELESQNKALIDMVEMQSEKISRLEAPKNCDGCKYYFTDIDGDGCKLYESSIAKCSRQYEVDYYKPKDD